MEIFGLSEIRTKSAGDVASIFCISAASDDIPSRPRGRFAYGSDDVLAQTW